jgi:hypothetical protein
MIKTEYVTAYLPYKLQVMDNYGVILEVQGIDLHHPNTLIGARINFNFNEIKLVLRPMEDLMKSEFKMDKVRKDAIMYLVKAKDLPGACKSCLIGSIMYRDFKKLLEWNFDIFGLIGDGAIDINKIKDYEHFSNKDL